MKKRYDNITKVQLEFVLPSNYFRLVNAENRKQPHGISEIPVLIDLKKDFGRNLSFNIPWDGELYGFLRGKNKLFEKINNDMVAKATINNWDNGFVIIFESKNGTEGPVYSIEKSEVIKLLEECIKPESLL